MTYKLTVLSAGLIVGLLGHSSARSETVIRAVMLTVDHGYMIYDTLFALDADGDIKPQMVGAYTLSRDQMTYTFTLRDGLKFHDGAPVTSADAIASIRRWLARDTLGLKLAMLITDLAAKDEKTFEIKLKEPNALLLYALAKPANFPLYILPKRIADGDPHAQVTDFTGSGPFVFRKEEFRAGDKLVFVKNRAYQPRPEPASGLAGGKVVKVDRVEWITMPDPQQQVNALLGGEIDYVQMPLIDLFPLLVRDPNVRLIEYNKLGYQLDFRFNWVTKPFDDARIRHAAWYALNQTDFLNAAIGDARYFQTCKTVFVCGSKFETTAGMDGLIEANFNKSKALLKEAGYDGTTVVIIQYTGLGSNVGPVAASLLRRGGFKVDIQWMDGEAWDARLVRKDPSNRGGWSAVVRSQQVVNMLNPIEVPMLDAGCDKAQPGWPCDSKLEALRADFMRASSLEEQKKLAEAIQLRAIEVSTHVPLGQFHVPLGVRASLHGVLTAPAPVFWNISKTEN